MRHDVGRTEGKQERKREERKRQLSRICEKKVEFESTQVNSGVELSVTRERVHDDAVLLRSRQELVVDDVRVLDPLVLGRVGEALLLDSRHVEDVRLGDDTRERGRLEDLDTRLLCFELDRFGHRETGRSDKVESDRVEREESDEGVDRAAVLQVSDHRDREPVDGTEFLTDRVDIEECLYSSNIR